MANVVYLLGAGFDCSVLDPTRGLEAPLARNFFGVLLRSKGFRVRLDGIRRRLFVSILLDEIKRYWGLDLDTLAATPFDIEECMTLFESQLFDGQEQDREVTLRRAVFALRNLLLMYLGELSHSAHTPTGDQFGREVISSNADVLTFNYDTLAEETIAQASGLGPKPTPSRDAARGPCQEEQEEVADEDLDASHFAWKPQLAYGFEFAEVSLPVAGVSRKISRGRYYAHPNNSLYTSRRVLKLHGSIAWLRYTPQRIVPEEVADSPAGMTPEGIILARGASYWMGESPTQNGWHMEPVVIPPQLYKQFTNEPFPEVWKQALETLSTCHTLVVVGYSFPPTDFRTRRLFLEAFADHRIDNLIVVNPDVAVSGLVRRLTRYKGPVVACDSLQDLYGLPSSWFGTVGMFAPDKP